jgi:hypothetical protein
MLTRALLRLLLLPLAKWVPRTRFWAYYQESLGFDRWGAARRDRLRSARPAEKRKLFSGETMTGLRGCFESRLLQQLYTLPPLEPMPVDNLAPVLDDYLRGLPVYLLWLADRCQDRGAAPLLRTLDVGPGMS